ncbi:lytic transglycosylase domain-containing protein [Actinoplanes sp. KI2]|uniref:lytic transglycosylase domain-containing protein n=1 Tax=Actinoplanes sp. KI2 TaxID=2983315 RepID=UPI0021D5EE35|nr:lytic transglycosylase domain-containing protein [Actinoplanes sp. KI2]MCU7723460.1 lytic transglycosylase domain-containing protein [Actinoplanes sp. KI2]
MGLRAKVLAAAVALVVAAGCGLTGHDKNAAATQPNSGPVWDTEPPSAEPTVDDLAAESPTPSPSPSKTSAKPKTKATTKPTPTGPVNNFQHADCYHYDGKAVSKKSAKAALNAAAAKHYWPTSAPTLTVSSDLVRSVAWNESGWQSNIVNCDGGFGLMQLMPGTVDMINTRFEQSYDVRDYKQNAILGANYLAWLTKWMGDHYFKSDNYSLSTSKCSSTTSWCLLNAVIAAYHVGSGTVDAAAASKKLPSADYVNTVRSLMKSCFCDTY